MPNVQKENTQPKQKDSQKRFIVLPYSNHRVDKFAEKLTNLVKKNYPQIDLKVAFKAPNEIVKMFPFKVVVVSIISRCETCGQEYIGKTERILNHRINEHNNAKKDSAIQTHLLEHPTHIIDASNNEIIDKADNNFKLMLKEMLHISALKPQLNTQYAVAYKKTNNKEMLSYQLKTKIIARRV